MTIIFDGTNGITSPGGDTANTSYTSPILKSASSLTFQTNGSTTAMTIDTSQNVGIGTANANGKAEVVSTSAGTNTNALFLTNASSNSGTATSLVFGVATAPTVRNATIRGINTGGNTIDLAFLTSNGDVPVERMRILNTGNILSLAGGSITATGTGITFPATQSASSDANTLDDYEEGTFTPTITSGITSPVYNTQSGYYTKIGNTVFITARVVLTSGTTNGNTLEIGNLPFTVFNSTSPTAVFPVGTVYINVAASSATNIFVVPIINTTVAQIYIQNATDIAGFAGTNFGSTGNVDFQCYYRVN